MSILYDAGCFIAFVLIAFSVLTLLFESMGSSGMLSVLDMRERVPLLVAAVDKDELFRFFAIVIPLPIVDVSRFENSNLVLVFPANFLLLSQQSPLLQIVNGCCRLSSFLFP